MVKENQQQQAEKRKLLTLEAVVWHSAKNKGITAMPNLSKLCYPSKAGKGLFNLLLYAGGVRHLHRSRIRLSGHNTRKPKGRLR